MTAKPGDQVRKLRERLKNNVDATMRQLSWNILEYGRNLSMDGPHHVSKGTFLSSWVLGVGSKNPWVASTKFEPYSWETGNDLRSQYIARVRGSYTQAMKVSFSIPFVVSNATPYLFQDVNTNPEHGGTSETAIDGSFYNQSLLSFARTEAKRLFATMPLDRLLYPGVVV